MFLIFLLSRYSYFIIYIKLIEFEKQYELSISMENDNIIDLNDFEMNSKIGKGGFAIVYKVTKKETKEIFAAKMLRNDIDSISRDEMLSILHEVNIMAKFNHPSILRFFG